MAFGLPVAVAVGWNLAVPVKRPAAVGVPGGEGVLGAAPARTATEPVAVRYSARPYRPVPTVTPTASATSVAVPSAPSRSPAATVVPPPASPSPGPSESVVIPLPPLDQPPVPTPTEVSSWPAEPAEPSTSSSAPAAQPSE
ncbi:hypothetical protein [Paractinoplanes hotanensis]|uniref:Uncharacterized protein n=1 Tax=Paractinoplanes hotanensis TaxID=2906497 RepID=A0ABT0XU03_9ACTN|nr:hypothetical protein [Actinoplanes hotanensis]MCM4077261.1 hypothetical protein [Actinoplanes hotanensis]